MKSFLNWSEFTLLILNRGLGSVQPHYINLQTQIDNGNDITSIECTLFCEDKLPVINVDGHNYALTKFKFNHDGISVIDYFKVNEVKKLLVISNGIFYDCESNVDYVDPNKEMDELIYSFKVFSAKFINYLESLKK